MNFKLGLLPHITAPKEGKKEVQRSTQRRRPSSSKKLVEEVRAGGPPPPPASSVGRSSAPPSSLLPHPPMTTVHAAGTRQPAGAVQPIYFPISSVPTRRRPHSFFVLRRSNSKQQTAMKFAPNENGENQNLQTAELLPLSLSLIALLNRQQQPTYGRGRRKYANEVAVIWSSERRRRVYGGGNGAFSPRSARKGEEDNPLILRPRLLEKARTSCGRFPLKCGRNNANLHAAAATGATARARTTESYTHPLPLLLLLLLLLARKRATKCDRPWQIIQRAIAASFAPLAGWIDGRAEEEEDDEKRGRVLSS